MILHSDLHTLSNNIIWLDWCKACNGIYCSVCFFGVESKGCYGFKSPHPVMLILFYEGQKDQFYQLSRC